jgi:hypothetical protein
MNINHDFHQLTKKIKFSDRYAMVLHYINSHFIFTTAKNYHFFIISMLIKAFNFQTQLLFLFLSLFFTNDKHSCFVLIICFCLGLKIAEKIVKNGKMFISHTNMRWILFIALHMSIEKRYNVVLFFRYKYVLCTSPYWTHLSQFMLGVFFFLISEINKKKIKHKLDRKKQQEKKSQS